MSNSALAFKMWPCPSIQTLQRLEICEHIQGALISKAGRMDEPSLWVSLLVWIARRTLIASILVENQLNHVPKVNVVITISKSHPMDTICMPCIICFPHRTARAVHKLLDWTILYIMLGHFASYIMSSIRNSTIAKTAISLQTEIGEAIKSPFVCSFRIKF